MAKKVTAMLLAVCMVLTGCLPSTQSQPQPQPSTASSGPTANAPKNTETPGESAPVGSPPIRNIPVDKSDKKETPPVQPAAVPYYMLSFETNGGRPIEPLSLRRGSKLENLPTPTKKDATFAGWYYDQRFKKPVQEGDTLLADMTIFSKWSKEPDNLYPSAPYYTLTFHSNGGSDVKSFSRKQGKPLTNLPIPYKENSIFQGWYYDQALTQLVSDRDTIQKNMEFYADWREATPLLEKETPHFASATDQTPDFTIEIQAPEGWTEEQVKAGITVKNFNTSDQEDLFVLHKAGEGVFTVSGQHTDGKDHLPGFEEGGTYKLTLEDAGLSFVGYAPETRDFNFIIKKADVYNLQLSADLRYIKFSDITNLVEDGKKVDLVSTPLTKITEDGTTAADLVKGTFTYTKGTFKVGDTVTIYEGIHPAERVLDDTREGADGAIAYVEITSVKGNTYGYKTANAQNVLFTPDILPVPTSADLDGDPNNHTITVSKQTMDFSDDLYEAVHLDALTTVDKGDYLSFYEGSLDQNPSTAGYGLITEVTAAGDTYIITYVDQELQEVLDTMDMYNTTPLSGEEMLKNVDVPALERSIAKQARDSGFAEEAGNYLAALALETDSFTTVSEDFELQNFRMLNKDGSSIDARALRSMRKKANVEVKTDVTAKIYSNLENFDVSGMGLLLTVTAEVTIEPDDDNQIVITVEGEFVEELHFAINVDGGARWKWWGIFPYIAEYEITANIDMFNYTGIDVQASMVTKEKEDNKWTENKDLQNITDELKKLLDAVKEGQEGDEESPGEGLVAKYKEMLETESDWVKLVEKEIFKYKYPIPPIFIIVIEMNIDFVISANMNIALGCNFYYINAKRYSYLVEVFAGDVTSDVIDFVEERYEFTFYVMGTLGLRAGIKAEFKIALFTSKFASVGFGAEVGAYLKLYGYFYYELTYAASVGKSSRYAGALYLELGIYLEITFEAQAFAGTFSYNPTLYEEEWPLWSAGMRENILDFAYGEQDSPDLKMKKALKTAMVPDSVFEMLYLDLKTGDDVTKIYNDDEKHFLIQMTNDAFAYDRSTNKVTVVVPEKEFQLDGQMVITWVNAPLSWTSAPIMRKIDLHWDNLNDGYAMVFQTNGGTNVPMLVAKYGETIRPIAEPAKRGYTFGGWYADEALSTPYTIPETMPNTDLEIYAKWVPATDTPYTVEHYHEVLGSSQYMPMETATLTGTTDSTVAAATKTYTGFIPPAEKQITIAPDGSSVLRYYYDRQSYDLTFDLGVAGGEPTVTSLKYGAAITLPQVSSKGYRFTGWQPAAGSPEVPTPAEGQEAKKIYMPANPCTYTAQWEATQDTPYRVEYYVQQLSGAFTLQRLEHKTGVTGAAVPIETLFDPSYVVENGITYRDATVSGEVTASPKITSDGKLIIKLNYQREDHTLTFVLENGEEDIVQTLSYQSRIIAPKDPVRAGYTFTGWDKPVAAEMGTADQTYTAQWKANTNTPYLVEHYQQNANDEDYTWVETDRLSGTTDTEVTAAAKKYAHFTLNEAAPDYLASGTVAGDGSLVLKLYYDREVFTVRYNVDGEDFGSGDYKHGETVYHPAAPTKEGYNFGYWLLDEQAFNNIMPPRNITLFAHWLPLTDYSYTIGYYTEGLNGDFTLREQETLVGTYDSEILLTPTQSYTGFTTPEPQTVLLNENSFRFDYLRNRYPLQWELGGGTITNEEAYTPAGEVLFETPIVPPLLTKEGYTYTWNEEILPIMPDAACAYTAVWAPNPYTLTLDSNGGAGEEIPPIHLIYDEPQTLPKNSYIRTGYTFAGWASTRDAAQSAYPDEAPVSNLTGVENGSVTLYAVWEPIPYTITYHLDGGINNTENPTRYSIESGSITLRDAAKTGYTFEGWYTESTLENPAPSIAIPEGSVGEKAFYAKWTPNTYLVAFHKNIGDGTSQTQAFTYDVESALQTNSFTWDGYTFAGWATSAAGTKAYEEGAMVKNLAPSGTVNLYALWAPIPYGITYVLNGGNDDHGNPTSYNIASDDIQLKGPSRGNGYSFAGWYDNSDLAGTPVTKITKGSTGDRTLYAKWGFAGRFNIRNNGDNTFTITRDGGTTGVQTVFFRTVNGTAVGDTHFVHQGGVGAYAAFAEGESSKVVTVQEYGVDRAYGEKQATAYSNIDRSYGLELVSVNGGGLLGSTTKATRVMPKNPAKTIPAGFYQMTTFSRPSEERITVNKYDAGSYYWNTTDSHNFTMEEYAIDGINYSSTRPYWIGTTKKIFIDVSIDFDEKKECWVGFRITELGSFSTEKASKTRDSNGIDRESLSALFDTTTNGVSAYYGVKGGASNTIYAKWPQYTLKVNDTVEPILLGLAPLSQTSFQAGETVTLSLIYDEIVASAEGVSIRVPILSDTPFTLVGGTGSNILCFQGTVTKDYSQDLLAEDITVENAQMIKDMAN